MNIETKEGLFALMEQIAEEREAARPIVEQLLASGEPLEDIEIPEGWRTAGMVLELCDIAYSRDETEPLLSLALGHLALVISFQVKAADKYGRCIDRYLNGRSWKEIGLAHRFLCTFIPASRAFENAAGAFASNAALGHAIAWTYYARAQARYGLREFNEAERLNAEAHRLFIDLADERRSVICEILSGALAFRRGDAETACQKLEMALRVLRDLNDLPSIGITYNNLGVIYRTLGRKSDAIEALRCARDISIDLQLPCEVNRADWNLAVFSLEDGDFNSALNVLLPIRRDFLERQMAEDAAEVGLCMLDALIAMNELKKARLLAEEVLQEFSSIQIGGGATTALAYLREVLRASGDRHPAVRHVRQYIETLRWEPARLFVPLQN
jgi:tetratricopeptide (TPR) repeat protein